HAEKLTNLDKLPPHGFKVALFPIKVKKASGAWIRAVAFLDEER
ncbi:MAG TPA: cyclase family protein, partial [Candidatus Methylomirabilis sp.]